MATDVFSRDVSYGGSFSADGCRVTFSDFGAGLLVQTLTYQYQQQISRLYEVGSPYLYLIAGRTQGRVGMSRVIGPKRIMPAFYAKYGDVCKAGDNNLKIGAKTGCHGGASDTGAEQKILLRNCVISQLGGSVNANDVLITENLDMMFLLLQFV